MLAPTSWITIDLCKGYDWVAYLNEGGRWTRLKSNERLQSFPATERLAIATVLLIGSEASITIDHLTATQAVARPCFDNVGGESGATLVTGSVAGVGPEYFSTVALTRAAAAVHPDSLTFRWYAPAGPNDILGLRRPRPSNPWIVDRMIFRRGLDLTGVSTIPTLDFESAEAFAPAANLVTIDGGAPAGGVNIVNYFRSATGLSVTLSFSFNILTSEIVYAVPGDRLVDGDMHQLNVGAAGRSVTHYYRQPVDRTITLGPPMATPTFTTISSGFYVRVRADLTAQAEYDSSVQFRFSFNRGPSVTMTATRDYFGGTPSTWSLTMPDLSTTDGFQLAWGPHFGAFGSSVVVSDQRPDFYVTGPHDGEMVRSADRLRPP